MIKNFDENKDIVKDYQYLYNILLSRIKSYPDNRCYMCSTISEKLCKHHIITKDFTLHPKRRIFDNLTINVCSSCHSRHIYINDPTGIFAFSECSNINEDIIEKIKNNNFHKTNIACFYSFSLHNLPKYLKEYKKKQQTRIDYELANIRKSILNIEGIMFGTEYHIAESMLKEMDKVRYYMSGDIMKKVSNLSNFLCRFNVNDKNYYLYKVLSILRSGINDETINHAHSYINIVDDTINTYLEEEVNRFKLVNIDERIIEELNPEYEDMYKI